MIAAKVIRLRYIAWTRNIFLKIHQNANNRPVFGIIRALMAMPFRVI